MTIRNQSLKYADGNSGDRLCRKKEVLTRTGLSDTSVWRREQAGQFPPRIRLGARCTVWRESDLEAWFADPANYAQEVASHDE